MQALFCDVIRARRKLGTAMVASKPMMATTIMISTSVKPAGRCVLIFMSFLSYFCREPNRLADCLVHKVSIANCGHDAAEGSIQQSGSSPEKSRGIPRSGVFPCGVASKAFYTTRLHSYPE